MKFGLFWEDDFRFIRFWLTKTGNRGMSYLDKTTRKRYTGFSAAPKVALVIDPDTWPAFAECFKSGLTNLQEELP